MRTLQMENNITPKQATIFFLTEYHFTYLKYTCQESSLHIFELACIEAFKQDTPDASNELKENAQVLRQCLIDRDYSKYYNLNLGY